MALVELLLLLLLLLVVAAVMAGHACGLATMRARCHTCSFHAQGVQQVAGCCGCRCCCSSSSAWGGLGR
jgi:hypothetical protein